MKKANKKIVLLIIVLVIVLVGSIVILGTKSKKNQEEATNQAIEQIKQEAEQLADGETKKKSGQGDSSNQSQNGSKTKKGKRKDLGGGLYLNPDGSIETEILP